MAIEVRANGDVPFRDIALEWQQMQIHRPATALLVNSQLRNHILPVFGDRPIGSIRPGEIQSWVRSRSDIGLAASTIQMMTRSVGSMFTMAVADRLLERNPCAGVRLPRRERPPVIPPTLEQVEALIAAMSQRFRPIVVLAAGTGLRQGECLGLGINRVDFEGNTVTVDRQLVLTTSPPVLAPPKTRASYRRVPLPQVVARSLAEHLERHPPGPDGLVFTNGRGAPIRRNRFGESWRATVRRAGVPDGIRFHDLRHFYASLLIRHGESVKVVQARLGHASATETLDTYSHLWPDDGERTRAAVDAVFLGGIQSDTIES